MEEKNLYERLLEKKQQLFDEYDAARRAGARDVPTMRKYGEFILELGTIEDQMTELLEGYS